MAWKKGGRNGVVVRGAGGPGAGGNQPGGGTVRIGRAGALGRRSAVRLPRGLRQPGPGVGEPTSWMSGAMAGCGPGRRRTEQGLGRTGPASERRCGQQEGPLAGALHCHEAGGDRRHFDGLPGFPCVVLSCSPNHSLVFLTSRSGADGRPNSSVPRGRRRCRRRLPVQLPSASASSRACCLSSLTDGSSGSRRMTSS